MARIFANQSRPTFVAPQDNDYTDSCFRRKICVLSVQIHQAVLQCPADKSVSSACLPYRSGPAWCRKLGLHHFKRGPAGSGVNTAFLPPKQAGWLFLKSSAGKETFSLSLYPLHVPQFPHGKPRMHPSHSESPVGLTCPATPTPWPELLGLHGLPSSLPLLLRPHSPAFWALGSWALPSLFKVAHSYLL